MTAQPLVSVVIPCYNARPWIAATVASVYAQTWPRLEVIVVDDGSTDGSAGALEPFSGRGLKLLTQENRGQPAAFNRGLAAACGDFIQYLDADDLLAPTKIEAQVTRLIESPRSIAASRWSRFRDDPAAAAFRPLSTDRDMTPVEWLLANWDDGGGMMYPAMWLLPRALVQAIGPWREDLSLVNDTEYFTRAVLAADRVLFCADAKTYYRSGHGATLSAAKSEAAWRSYHAVLAACQSYLLAREDTDRTRRATSMLWQRFARGCYPYDRTLADDGLRRASLLHPAQLPLEGGKLFHLLAATIGWKRARVLQRLAGRP